ncbi:copper amine oxidase N-terminal domain-containing protein [Gudongella sp. DL1XJH-153]|uniref:copper amine oxidase N-terminal domain-containing protein n=1 Tax=Gudongella sp. DL1XJH-153 TaxID=3409804 RepID=UPI003BB75B5C
MFVGVKKLIATVLSILIVMILPTSVQAQTIPSESPFDGIDYTRSEAIRVVIDGEDLQFDVAPRISGGRTLVPMRAIFEEFGLEVSWNEEERTVTGEGEGLVVRFEIDSNQATVNGLVHTLDAPATIIDGRTMVPLRFLSEALGYNVVWIADSQLILLSREPIIEWRYGGFEEAKPYREYEYKYYNGEVTSEYRYTGTFKDVEHLNLYRKDGRIIPNVPDFKLDEYSYQWSQKSPFTGKTWWIHRDQLEGSRSLSIIRTGETLEPLTMGELEDMETVGGYVRISVQDHLFDLQLWKELIGSSGSKFASAINSEIFDETEIPAYDTILRVTVGDGVDGYIPLVALRKTIIEPEKDRIYIYLERDPTTLFTWDRMTWNRLDRELPWVGMTSDMLLVKLKESPDQTAKITTEFSVLELWVYQHEYGDVIYYFDDGVLVNMW